jgi:hypothetical protein
MMPTRIKLNIRQNQGIILWSCIFSALVFSCQQEDIKKDDPSVTLSCKLTKTTDDGYGYQTTEWEGDLIARTTYYYNNEMEQSTVYEYLNGKVNTVRIYDKNGLVSHDSIEYGPNGQWSKIRSGYVSGKERMRIATYNADNLRTKIEITETVAGQSSFYSIEFSYASGNLITQKTSRNGVITEYSFEYTDRLNAFSPVEQMLQSGGASSSKLLKSKINYVITSNGVPSDNATISYAYTFNEKGYPVTLKTTNSRSSQGGESLITYTYECR